MPHYCPGRWTGVPCCFSSVLIGGRARQKHAGRRCRFCDDKKIQTACKAGATRSRDEVLKMLTFFRDHYQTMPQVYNAAIMLVPADLQDEFHAAVVGRASIATLQANVDNWKTHLQDRGGSISTSQPHRERPPNDFEAPRDAPNLVSMSPLPRVRSGHLQCD